MMNIDTADLAVLHPLADACPTCHPGDHPAVAPTTITDDGGSLRAAYQHEVCGTAWECAWDAASVWPSHNEPPLPVGALLTGLLDHLLSRHPDHPETRTA
jgi:hypothetical protein